MGQMIKIVIDKYILKLNKGGKNRKIINRFSLGLQWVRPIFVMSVFWIIQIVSKSVREVSTTTPHHFWGNKIKQVQSFFSSVHFMFCNSFDTHNPHVMIFSPYITTGIICNIISLVCTLNVNLHLKVNNRTKYSFRGILKTQMKTCSIMKS